MTDASAPVPRRALVLSGGGIRFALHAGVLNEMRSWTTTDGQAWLNAFTTVVGTSAGALYAGLFAAGYDPGRIAMFAGLFRDAAFGNRLFDRNYRGFAAAYLKYDTSAVLGALRGDRILTLLETVLSKEARSSLTSVSPSEARRELERCWSAQAKKKRRMSAHDYYADQVTFADCPDLFLIGTNALTGQKVVFCRVGDRPAEEEREKRSFTQLDPPRMYLQTPAELDRRVGEAYAAMGQPVGHFIRVDQRAHWRFDHSVYGDQLPVALGVRASLSIPVIFEPLRVLRERAPGKTRHEDVFVDGGVDDGFSLEVAVDPEFGGAQDVFGIDLGNLGYRIPDHKAARNIPSLLMRTIDYMGDAVIDMERRSSSLSGARITVLNARSSNPAQLTDTNAIADLITEGQGIAKMLWTAVHPGAPSSSYGTIDVVRFFRPAPIRVVLSDAAVFDVEALKTSLAIESEQDMREDVAWWRILVPPPNTGWWFLILYVFAAVLGTLVLLAVDDAARQGATLFGVALPVLGLNAPLALVFGYAIVVLSRAVAYLVWLLDRDDEA